MAEGALGFFRDGLGFELDESGKFLVAPAEEAPRRAKLAGSSRRRARTSAAGPAQLKRKLDTKGDKAELRELARKLNNSGDANAKDILEQNGWHEHVASVPKGALPHIRPCASPSACCLDDACPLLEDVCAGVTYHSERDSVKNLSLRNKRGLSMFST